MSHAAVLTQDVLDYVSINYPAMLEVMSEEAEGLALAINTLLEIDPPGPVMSDAYRVEFLKGFARSYDDILGA